MERQAKHVRRGQNHVLTPTKMLKLRVALLFALCGTMQWTMLWAMWFRRKQRAAIYLRWLQWTVQQPSAGAPVVIVAMDETSMSSVDATGHGTVVHDRDQHTTEQPMRTTQKMRRLTLLASVCSDPEIQKHLPQIWLLRSKESKRPPTAVAQAFLAAGYPPRGMARHPGLDNAVRATSMVCTSAAQDLAVATRGSHHYCHRRMPHTRGTTRLGGGSTPGTLCGAGACSVHVAAANPAHACFRPAQAGDTSPVMARHPARV